MNDFRNGPPQAIPGFEWVLPTLIWAAIAVALIALVVYLIRAYSGYMTRTRLMILGLTVIAVAVAVVNTFLSGGVAGVVAVAVAGTVFALYTNEQYR